MMKPGIYTSIGEAAYHADPCEAPSLSASIARILIERSPLHAWHAHPKLNPAREAPDPSAEQEIGSAAHAMLLGVGARVQVVEAADWRTKAAREARDAARATGRIPLLADDLAHVEAMVRAAREQLPAHDVGNVFTGGTPEATMIWREGATWCRSRIDYLPAFPEGSVTVPDYKTTSGSAHPIAYRQRLYQLRHDIQAAFYERGLRALCPEIREVTFAMICQETYPPYALSVVALSGAALEQAREDAEHAIDVWRRCLAAQRWPGYPKHIAYVDPTPAASARHEDRKLTREVHGDALKLGMDWQRPVNSNLGEPA